jgi:hypothetical protein
MPCADACSTLMLILCEINMSEGSKGEHDTVTGSAIHTFPDSCGAPRLTVIACAEAVIAPKTATTAPAERTLLSIASPFSDCLEGELLTVDSSQDE